MYKKLLYYFHKINNKRLIKEIAKIANEIIYSEKYDLTVKAVQQKIINEILEKNDSFNLVNVYITVNYTLYNKSPLDDLEVEDIYNQGEEIAKKIYESNDINLIQSYIDSESLKMEENLLKTNRYLENGKKAFMENPNSFFGALYKFENVAKGPSTFNETKDLKKLCDKLTNDVLECEQINAKQKELNDEISELTKINAMIKSGNLHEFELSLLNDMKLAKDLEKKLNSKTENEDAI
jgi:hypothetical protein